jgi:hypothetical protein
MTPQQLRQRTKAFAIAIIRLEVLVEAEIVKVAATRTLLKEADELTRIFVSSRETARRNRRLRRAAKRPNANREPRTPNLEPRT